MASRGRVSTVTIAGEHRLHKESMLSYCLLRAKPIRVKLKTITRQPLLNASQIPRSVGNGHPETTALWNR